MDHGADHEGGVDHFAEAELFKQCIACCLVEEFTYCSNNSASAK